LDDASLWDLKDGRLLIQTLDFFTPIVDDPHAFGAIAATNALSDVYAMGGTPATAMSILAFPTSVLSLDLLQPLMQGAVEKINESGAILCGGHSIDDDTLKLGFSVAGFVEDDSEWTNSGAQVGDYLVLTKALGTGTLSSALKSNVASKEWVDSMVESMTQLNCVPQLLVAEIRKGIHAATDITGFGLAGHLLQMMRASDTSAKVSVRNLPLLTGVRESLRAKNLNRAHKTNRDYCESETHWDDITEDEAWLTLDPQTSGGLLLSVAPSRVDQLVSVLRAKFPVTSVIGRVEAPVSKSRVRFIDSKQ